MAAGRVLGEAWIVISPDTQSFLADLTAKVKAAVQAVPEQDVKVGADASKLTADLTALRAQLAAALGKAQTIKLDGDTGALTAKIAGISARAAALAKQMSAMSMGGDTTKIDAAIAKETVKLTGFQQQLQRLQMGADTSKIDQAIAKEVVKIAGLQQQMDSLQLDADDKAFALKMATQEALVARLQEQLGNLKEDADSTLLDAKLDSALAELEVLRSQALKIKMSADTVGLFTQLQAAEDKVTLLRADAANIRLMNPAQIAAVQAQIAATLAEIEKLKREAADITIGGDPAQLARIAAGVAAVTADVNKLAAAQSDAGVQTTLFAKAMDYLGARFGPGGQGIGWTAAIGGIAGWHIALDAAIEAMIIATGVTAALGAAFAGTWPAIDQVSYHTKAAMDVMTAFGVDAGSLAGSLDGLQKSLAPQVIEAFGGAINALTGQTGALGRAAHDVTDLVDTWIAKIDLWSSSQKSLGGIMQAGVGYLEQLGKAAGIFAQAIDNLLTKDPGVAHYLLDMIQGLAEILNLFSKLPAPIVEAVLLFHGLYVWASVLGGVFGAMSKPIITAVTNITAMGAASKATAAEMTALAASEAKVGEAGAAAALGETAAAAGEAEVAAGGFVATLSNGLGAVKNFGLGLLALATNPITWAVGAAALIGGIVYEMRQMPGAAKDWIDWMNKVDSSMSASQAIPEMAKQIGQLQYAMANAFSQSNISQLEGQFGGFTGFMKASLIDTGDAAVDWSKGFTDVLTGNAGGALKQFKALWGTVFSGGQDAAMHQAGMEVQAYAAQIDKLMGAQKNLYGEVGNLMGGFNTLKIGALGYSQALTLMDLAGVRSTDSMAVMQQKVANLVTGYNEMSAGGTQLQNSINAVTFATEMQDSKVQELNTSWDAFFKLVSGGVSDFLGFAQQVNGMNEAFAGLGANGAKLTVSNGKVSDSIKTAATAATGGKASMTGLNDASIAAQQTLLKTAESANQQMDSLQSLAAAAGMGQAGMDKLQQANKDMLATMLPAAKTSQQMTDVLYALAQRGGYRGADSFQALSEWVGKSKNPMLDLQGIVTLLTTKAGNLADDVKNLSVALGQGLTDAMKSAVFQASNAGPAFDNFAKAVLGSKANSKEQQDAALQLGDALIKVTGSVSQAKEQFLVFAQGALHMGTQEANTLWNEISGKLIPAMDTAGKKSAPAAQKAFEALAGPGGGTGMGLTIKQSDILWKDLTDNVGGILDILAKDKNPAAQAAFEKLAGPGGALGMGLAKAQADKLYDSLHGNLTPILQILAQTNTPAATKAFDNLSTAMGNSKTNTDLLRDALQKLPSNVGITVKMSGTGDFIITEGGKQYDISQGGLLSPHAAGGFISGGVPGRDSVAALLMPGEVVVPTKMVQQGAVDHLRGQLPGFAAGGQVPGYAAGGIAATGSASAPWALTPDYVNSTYSAFTGAMAHTMETGLTAAVKTAKAWADNVYKQQTAQASVGYAAGPAAYGSALAAQNYAKSILWAYGWGMNQWPPLLALWNQESGWNPYAVNPSSGAYGIPQALGHGHPYNLGDYANQVRWGLAYISGRYGSPAAAWAHEVAYNWYGAGGQVPEYASGGQVPGMASGGIAASSWVPRLQAAQSGEAADYAGLRGAYLTDLAHAAPGSWTALHKAGITSELGTLANRQAAEVAAYKAILAHGTAKSYLSHFGTTVKGVDTVSRDIDLSHSHPGWTSGLQGRLAALSTLAGQNVAVAPGPVAAAVAKLAFGTWLARLKTAEKNEQGGYTGLLERFYTLLVHMTPSSWLYKNRTAVREQLYALAIKQNAEVAAFNTLVAHGTGSIADLTAMSAHISALTSAADVAYNTTKPSLLGHAGGAPAQVEALRKALQAVTALTHVPPINPAWQPGNLGPSHTVTPGVLQFARGGRVFDSGGWLAPGPNLAWNLTGKPEHVTPDRGGGGDIHVHVHNTGVIGSQQQLDAWLTTSVNRLARTGYINQMVRNT